MDNIHICICSRLELRILFLFVFVQEKNNLLHYKFPNYHKKKEGRSFSLNNYGNNYGKVQFFFRYLIVNLQTCR